MKFKVIVGVVLALIAVLAGCASGTSSDTQHEIAVLKMQLEEVKQEKADLEKELEKDSSQESSGIKTEESLEIKTNEDVTLHTEIESAYLTVDELKEETLKQPAYVKETKYLDSSTFIISSNSMLQAILYNNSDKPIKNFVIGFAAWDKNGLPIKLCQKYFTMNAAYFAKINYNGINSMPGKTYKGEERGTYYGMEVDEALPIDTIKAIVISYEDFDGETWENPLVLDFQHLYEEKVLVKDN